MAQRILIAGPPANPLLQLVYLIVGVVLLIGAIVMGAIILAAAVGLALIFGIFVWIRIWWLRRKILRAARERGEDPAARPRPGGRGGVEITDVEYTVVRETRQDDR